MARNNQREDAKEKRFSYQCETCEFMFFSLEQVREHKAMTGHGRFLEKNSNI